MTKKEINDLMYVLGWLDTHIDNSIDYLDEKQTDAYRNEVIASWTMLSAGLEQLVKENGQLKMQIELIDQARNVKL